MNIGARGLFAGLMLGIVPALATAGISSFEPTTGFGEASYSQDEYDEAYSRGKSDGRVEASAECIADPKNCGCADGVDPCSVTVETLLAGLHNAEYGETEPNDHIVGADPLIPEANYWGQTPWIQDKVGDWHRDEDWFYITTDEPNEMATISFTVPDRVLTDTTRLSQGWLVSVRDAAGNVYAQFDTRYAVDDTSTDNINESKEISYPVFLGYEGTYYITVVPRIADDAGALVTDPSEIALDTLSVTYSPYTLSVILSYSGMEGTPPDVNFHDVETEPNDNKATANPLVTGVTMYGMLQQTSDTPGEDTEGNDVYLQEETDWFVYESEGTEQVVLSWCGREECKATCGNDSCSDQIFWFVQVTDSLGVELVSFNTNKTESVHFGLDEPGNYYVQVGFYQTGDITCVEEDTESDPVCTASEFQCEVLSYTAADPAVPGSTATCSYGSGNTCGSAQESEDDSQLCELDGTTADTYPLWRWNEVCTNFERQCLTWAPIIELGALSVEYNFTWWGTQLLPQTFDTEAFDEFLERPSFYWER